MIVEERWYHRQDNSISEFGRQRLGVAAREP